MIDINTTKEVLASYKAYKEAKKEFEFKVLDFTKMRDELLSIASEVDAEFGYSSIDAENWYEDEVEFCLRDESQMGMHLWTVTIQYKVLWMNIDKVKRDSEKSTDILYDLKQEHTQKTNRLYRLKSVADVLTDVEIEPIEEKLRDEIAELSMKIEDFKALVLVEEVDY